jgi:large subunit ribosomal protein L3
VKALLGSKVGMTQVCDPQGAWVAASVVHVGGCAVTASRTIARDGYESVQVTYYSGGETPRFVREVRPGFECDLGQTLLPSLLTGVPKVDVVGVSKGRGFAGVMKRHNFSGLCASHGVKKVHRSGGSTGQSTDPGRVFKGAKMPGRFGGVRVTTKSLPLFSVDDDLGVLVVLGAVPGFAGGYLVVRECV